MKEPGFEFEKLTVWQRAMEFAQLVISFTEDLESDRKHYRIVEQLESSAVSVPMNIAEGRGRNSTKAYILHLTYFKGSLYKALTLNELMSRKHWISLEQNTKTRQLALQVIKMLNKLISTLNRKLSTP